MLYVRMPDHPFRRFTALLAMLLMASQASPALCVAVVCPQRTLHASESPAAELERPANHSHEHNLQEPAEDEGPAGRLPAPPDCQVMAQCTVALFGPAVTFAESDAPIASGSLSVAGLILVSRIATPDTPPPRA